MDSTTQKLVLVLWVLSVGFCMLIGFAKRKMGVGLIIGAILGPLGIVVMLCLSTASRPVEQFSLARGQTRLGDFSLTTINQMIGTGQLSPTDFYLDPMGSAWKPLRDLPGALFPVKS